MHKEWTVYQGTRVKGFDLYELKVDPKGNIMCLENDDPESEANCSVWVQPPLAVVNTASQVVFDATQQAIRKKFPDVVRVNRLE